MAKRRIEHTGPAQIYKFEKFVDTADNLKFEILQNFNTANIENFISILNYQRISQIIDTPIRKACTDFQIIAQCNILSLAINLIQKGVTKQTND